MGKLLWWSFMLNVQYLAQVGHFLGGAWVVFLAGLFFGAHGLVVGAVGMFIATSAKEFVFDILVERDGWKNSAQDWVFWQLGGAAGFGLFELARHADRLAR